MLAGMMTLPMQAGQDPNVAADRIIGLLTLPEVFGNEPCEKFSPVEISLYATPTHERLVGSIRVARHWTLPECSGLLVNVDLQQPPRVFELPTREFAYEAPAAIVLEERGRWFRLQLGHDSAWLRASGRDEYLPLEKLLPAGLTYLTDASDGRLSASPGAAPSARRERFPAGSHVRVVAFQRDGGQLWVHVEVMSHSICESAEQPAVVGNGWMPAHSNTGEPTVWFFSRGC
jgi:hypothetical protein